MFGKIRPLPLLLIVLFAGAVAYKWHISGGRLADRVCSLDDTTRNLAITELSKSADAVKSETVDVLVAAPPKKDARERRFAIYALRKAGNGNPAVLAYFVKSLADSEKTVRDEATVALMDAGEAALPSLFQALRTAPEPLRDNVLQIISKSQEKAVPGLLAALQDSPPLQLPIVRTFGQMGPSAKSAGPALTALLKGPDPMVRLEAAESLDAMGLLTKEAAPVLAQDLLKAKESYVDGAAPRPRLARLLEKIDPRRRELADLKFDLKQANAAIRYRAAYVLSEKKPPLESALGVLVEALQDADVFVSARAAVALARIGFDKTEPIKKTAIPRIRSAVQRADAAKIEGFDEIIQPALKGLPG